MDNKPIPYGRHDISKEDIDSVVKVLKSDYLTQGPEVEDFEHAFAKYVGANYAVAVANGTAALHLCTLSMNIRPGEKVITSPITFAASANCVRYAGGEVVFADIDPKTGLISLIEVEKLLRSSPLGTYSGVIPVDLAGNTVNLEFLRKLADEYELWIIEDACHAPGGWFVDSDGEKQLCGNGVFAELSIFSFHPVKHIAAGEGGMITTNDKALYEKLHVLRTHGITKNPNHLIENHGGWYYEMQELGYNYRLTDFQAALAKSQLKRADIGLIRRREIAQTYSKAFAGKAYIKWQSGTVEGHAYHLYLIQVDKRDDVYKYLHEHNIKVQIHYIPVHLMPYYKQYGWNRGDMPNAECYYKNCLSLPMFPSLDEAQLQYVITTIDDYFNN
jgi:UDP-4-amino-4,6-dideoxy-N-acetyl-beta-L-altrosamine transaminase